MTPVSPISPNRIVVLGAGQAGGEVAHRLRAGGYSGELFLIGDEPFAPYQRPPLSKKYLAGEFDLERLLLRPAASYDSEGVRLLTGTRALFIDRAEKQVRLEGGRALAYDALVIATGSRARRLPIPGGALPGVFTLRTVMDVDAMRPLFAPGARLVVIGGGYIGLEGAAVARDLGLDVTLIEAAPRLLARVAGPEIAGFFKGVHEAAGVRVELGAQVAEITGADRATGVRLAHGGEIAADLVILGVGVAPETKLAETAGLEVTDGIVVDRAMRTSDPDIFAIGDCVRRPLVHYGRTGRLESVHNAIEGAKLVAAHVLGAPPPAEDIPWFWSDQYDLKLTIAGLSQGADRCVLRGEPLQRSFAAFSFAGGRFLSVDAVNRPADYLAGKQLLQRGAPVAADALSDMSRTMKDIVQDTLAAAV